MNKLISVIFILLAISVNNLMSLPSAKVKTLRGDITDTKNITNDGKPFIVVFFGVCCGTSLNAMNDINEKIDEWREKYGIKTFAISLDDTRNSKKVASIASGKSWKFEIYLDENHNFKRAMNVNEKPHFFLFDGAGEIIWQQKGYSAGIADVISEEIDKSLKKEN